MPPQSLKLLFIINPGAGNNKTDWRKEIQDHFSTLPHQVELYELPAKCEPDMIAKKINELSPDKVIAVGGDGTLKLVTDSLKGKRIPIGLLPAGSANGMAKELGIPAEPGKALDVIVNGRPKKISLVKINDQRCIHLSDIGFNAFVVKKFEDENTRGMWGYIKAAWKVLLGYSKMKLEMKVDDKIIQREAAMVVIANATKYGTGVVINPAGRLNDNYFEVVIVKKISVWEIFKMRFSHKPYHPHKTELLQIQSLEIRSNHRFHFQVDGEYFGKINAVSAEVIPDALEVLVPEEGGQ